MGKELGRLGTGPRRRGDRISSATLSHFKSRPGGRQRNRPNSRTTMRDVGRSGMDRDTRILKARTSWRGEPVLIKSVVVVVPAR